MKKLWTTLVLGQFKHLLEKVIYKFHVLNAICTIFQEKLFGRFKFVYWNNLIIRIIVFQFHLRVNSDLVFWVLS